MRRTTVGAALLLFAVFGPGDDCGGNGGGSAAGFDAGAGPDGGRNGFDAAASGPDAAPPSPPCTPKPLPKSTASGDDLALATAIADRAMTDMPVEKLAWDWGEGVLVQAMVELGAATANAKYTQYAQAYYDRNVTNGITIASSDGCAPSIGAAELVQTTCEATYRVPPADVLFFLQNTALRTSDGGISHFGASTLFGATLWIDSLYMFGEALVRWGEAGPAPEALDLYAQQLGIFASHMQDADGLFHHSYDYPHPTDADVHWARGNAWVLASSTDYLRVRPDATAAATVKKLADGVLATQDASGAWWTVMNRPGDTYLETSATALFALGLKRAIDVGVLDASSRPAVDKALGALRANVADGVVKGVSGPTDAGTFDDYANVPIVEGTPYGAGLAIMALVGAGP